MKRIKLKKNLALIAFVALCGVVFAVGVTAIVKSMQFTIGVKYNPPYRIAVDLKLDSNYITIFDARAGGAIESASKYVAGISSDTLNLNKDYLQAEDGKIYFNLTNQESAKVVVFVLSSGVETIEIIVQANSTASAQALNVGDITNGAIITLQAHEQEVQSMGLTTNTEIEFNYNEISTKEAFEASEYFTNLEITETYNFGESQTFNLAENLDRYEISYSTTDFENTDEVTLTITNKANSELAPITKTISIKHFDFVATFSTDELDVVSATSSLAVTLGEDFSVTLQAQNANSTAFVFDITLKDSASNVMASSIASETIINYNWVKTATSNNYGTLTIPAQYLTSNVASVEISARAGTPWNNTSTTISTSGTVSISTPQQLAGLATQTNGGTKFSGVTLNLKNHLYLNDEIFLNLGNGYVKVTDGVNVAYLGDGSGRVANGTYSTLTTAGQWYSNTSETTGSYAGTLNSWTPIGTTSKYFAGTFDGGNYEISGMYINTTSSYQGLFGYMREATIQNLGVVNGYVKGGYNVGGICGFASSSSLENCTNFGTIAGSDANVGGICGYADDVIANCNNFGTIAGSGTWVGGICGSGYDTVSDCNNYGNVYGHTSVGGITGYVYEGYVKNCNNTGIVVGVDQVSGICGNITLASSSESSVLTSYILNCSTTNTYTGSTNVGELYGYYELFKPSGGGGGSSD